MHTGSVKIDVPMKDTDEVMIPVSFHVPCELLLRTSPVFATMLEGAWKESAERVITVDTYPPDDMREFLNCLMLVQNETAHAGLAMIFSPIVIRRVLPIANYFQVEVLKRLVVSTVANVLKECEDCPVRDPTFMAASGMLFAVEASLPESEIPDWSPEALNQLFLSFTHVNEGPINSWDSLVNAVKRTSTLCGKTDLPIHDLSKKTLVRCMQCLRLDLSCSLPAMKDKDEKVRDARWPAISLEVSSGRRKHMRR
jgi:hypothetical protein